MKELARMIKTNKKKENRKIAFDNYLKKHNLGEYRFYTSAHTNMYILKNDVSTEEISNKYFYYKNFNEIVSPHTLVRRLRSGSTFYVFDGNGKHTFKNLNDFKENILIERLAGLL